MPELDDLALFAAVVDHGGFAAAERALGTPKSRLSRRVAALESDLGVRLLQRSTRRFSVTEVGRDVHRHARAMLEAARDAREAVARVSAEPRGPVRVACPIALAQGIVASVLPDFLQRHPQVQVQLHVNNRRVDLIEEGFDIALRVRLTLDDDASLVARRLGIARKRLVASPAYLKRAGSPRHPRDLVHHAILYAGDEAHGLLWELQSPDGETERFEPAQPRLIAFDFPLLIQMAEAGQGITLLPELSCSDALVRGTLVPVLPEWEHPMGVCHLVYPSRRGMLPAVRALVEHFVQQLPPLIEAAHAPCSEARQAVKGTRGPAAGGAVSRVPARGPRRRPAT